MSILLNALFVVALTLLLVLMNRAINKCQIRIRTLEAEIQNLRQVFHRAQDFD